MKCKNCRSNSVIKKGIKKKKFQSAQRYFCKDCKRNFTEQPEQAANKTYPISIILKSVSIYNLGYTINQTSEKIEKKFKIKVPLSTLSSWLKESSSICTFSRLRKQSTSLYKPHELICKQTLNHLQPYTFKYHKAKLDILTKENPKFSAIKGYINKITSNNFPNHIFTYNKNNNEINYNNNPSNQRASKLKFSHLKINAMSKINQANQLAKLSLNLAKNNNDRHQALQDFMLINDSATIAVEMPTYLTNWDAGYYRNQRGFIFPLNRYKTPITGHIDLLQIRNGLIHILDYKPNADKIKPLEQLTLYALALSRKLNLQLYHFKCAWFDENSYFEFFPLHCVYTHKK